MLYVINLLTKAETLRQNTSHLYIDADNNIVRHDKAQGHNRHSEAQEQLKAVRLKYRGQFKSFRIIAATHIPIILGDNI